MHIIPWRLRSSLEIFTVSLKNDEFKECTCSCTLLKGSGSRVGHGSLGWVYEQGLAKK